jgi:hypothetical protein
MNFYSICTSYVRLTVALVILFAIPACTGMRAGRAMTCDEVKAESLHDFIRTNPSELDLTEWVLTEYEGSDPTASESGQSPSYSFIRWENAEFAYSTEFDEGELRQVNRRIEGATFTLAQVLECLGSPEYYHTDYYPAGGGGVILTLWYPTDGVVLYFDKKTSRNQAQIEFQGNEPISSIHYTTTTTLEDAVAVEYRAPSSGLAQSVLAETMPWSADTMPIVVEIPQ